MRATAAIHTGTTSLRLNNSVGGRRPSDPQGSMGATAMRNSSAKPIGRVIRSKYGLPTEMVRPSKASTSSGNTVPSSTTNANAANRALLARKAPSRDTGAAIRPGVRN